MRLRAAVGALAERNFRLLFASSTISGLGDGISVVALVFAVLQVSDSAIALGLVLAARQVADAAIVLAAGVWADRLPRHLVLIAVAVVGLAASGGGNRLTAHGFHVAMVACAGLALAGGALAGSCTCPVGREGLFCKHCVAVGLVWLERERDTGVPASAPTRSELRERRAALGAEARAARPVEEGLADE